MPLLPEPPRPPLSSREHETLIQYNLRNKVCAYCKRPGALLKCEGCRQRSYCDRKEHRGQCVKLQQVFVPPPPGWRDAAAAAAGGGGGAAAGGDGEGAGDGEEDEIENPCPICLDNEDDATVGGKSAGICFACGQSYCGACNTADLADRSPNCPICRAPIIVSEAEKFKRCWKLVHDRSPGRHTPAAQCGLGVMYRDGEGVEQDHVEAVKWLRKSAEAGYAAAQCNLSAMYLEGECVEQDVIKGVKWLQLAAEQGQENALNCLDAMLQANVIPTSPPGTAVTIILLTSANAAKYNNKTGRVVRVVAPTEGAAIKPGRAAVLLDGEAAPISFKLKNLQIHP
eukprot:gene9635-biopygen7268